MIKTAVGTPDPDDAVTRYRNAYRARMTAVADVLRRSGSFGSRRGVHTR